MKNFKNYKTKALAIFLVCSALLTACGSSTMNEAFPTSSSNSKGLSFSKDAASYDYTASDDYYDSGDYYDDYAAEEYSPESDVVYADETADTTKKGPDVSTDSIDREMLVYSCTMNVDVLDFDSSLESFKENLQQYQGFVEEEVYNDGGSSSRWYDESAEKWKSYKATVRIPSRVYEDFCGTVSELGDLRNKNATVENVSTEYKDLSTTLEIYEKKEERYIAMLGEIKNEEQAIAVEDKLTQIQIEISKLKTRMNQIKTDVSYSYVYVTINEVKEYQEEPVHTDTFGQRLANTLKNAGRGFLNFLEGLLFLIIYLLPYLLLFGAIGFVIVKAVKALRNKSKKRKEKKAAKKNPEVSEKKEELSESKSAPESENNETENKDK